MFRLWAKTVPRVNRVSMVQVKVILTVPTIVSIDFVFFLGGV